MPKKITSKTAKNAKHAKGLKNAKGTKRAKRSRPGCTEKTSDHPMREFVALHNSDALFADGFDDCIMGVAQSFSGADVAAYDTNKMIQKLMRDSEMSYEEAVDYFSFNILGGWHGKTTPIFVTLPCTDS